MICTAVSKKCINPGLLIIYAGIRGSRFVLSLANALAKAIIFRMSRGTAHTFARPVIISLSRVPVR